MGGDDAAKGISSVTDKQRIRELKAALRPFAKEAETWLASVSNRYRPGVTEPKQHQAHARAEFTLGDLRRAARLLEK